MAPHSLIVQAGRSSQIDHMAQTWTCFISWGLCSTYEEKGPNSNGLNRLETETVI